MIYGTRQWLCGWPRGRIQRRWPHPAGHTSVSFTLDRDGHLLPGSEQRLNDAIDALAEGAHATAEVTDDIHGSSHAREKTTSFAHVARTPEDSKDKGQDLQVSDQGENGGRLRDSNPRPQPCESVLGGFGDLGILRKVQFRGQMSCPLVSAITPHFALLRARSAHAEPLLGDLSCRRPRSHRQSAIG
jgi:hypothetical protein